MVKSLRVLDLSGNALTGGVLSNSANCSALEHLELEKNLLSGVIPQDLGMLQNLRVVNLGSNVLTGGLPSSLANASVLEGMDLSQNKVSGTMLKKAVPMWCVRWQHN